LIMSFIHVKLLYNSTYKLLKASIIYATKFYYLKLRLLDLMLKQLIQDQIVVGLMKQ